MPSSSTATTWWCGDPMIRRGIPVLALLLVLGCAATSPNAPATTASKTAARAPDVVVGRSVPRESSQSQWLPIVRNGEEGTIDGVPLISVTGPDVLVDGIAIGEVASILSGTKTTRIDGLFNALRSRREAWLTTHTGTSWPGVVAFRFGPDVTAAVVKSVILTSGYAACPNGSLLVETRGAGQKRVGRLAVDPLMIAAPEEKILTVEVRKDAFVVTWNESKTAVRAKEIPRNAATESEPLELPALAAEISSVWEAAGIHRSPGDKRVDQAILHVDDAVPYKVFAAVVDAIYAPRRTMTLAGREERVPALNVNLAAN